MCRRRPHKKQIISIKKNHNSDSLLNSRIISQNHTMKLSASFFALASAWRSAHGQKQESTFLRGSGGDAGAADFVGDGRAHERHVQSLFEEVQEDITTSIVGGGPVDPQEYKVRSYMFLVPL